MGNLSYDTDESVLRSHFEKFGSVERASVIKDKTTGRSKGFGFITMEDHAAAAKAVAELNGKEFDGRRVVVNQAQKREVGFGGGPRGHAKSF